MFPKYEFQNTQDWQQQPDAPPSAAQSGQRSQEYIPTVHAYEYAGPVARPYVPSAATPPGTNPPATNPSWHPSAPPNTWSDDRGVPSATASAACDSSSDYWECTKCEWVNSLSAGTCKACAGPSPGGVTSRPVVQQPSYEIQPKCDIPPQPQPQPSYQTQPQQSVYTPTSVPEQPQSIYAPEAQPSCYRPQPQPQPSSQSQPPVPSVLPASAPTATVATATVATATVATATVATATVATAKKATTTPKALLQVFENPKFVTREQTTLIIKEKFSDNYSIKDTKKRPWFQCRGRAFSFKEKKVLHDANGGSPIFVMKEAFDFGPDRQFVYDPTQNVKGRHMFAIVPKMTFVKAKMYATVRNRADRGRQANVVLKGIPSQRQAGIYIGEPKQGGKQIAMIQRRLTGGDFFLDRQTYVVTIQPGIDAALIVAMCIAFDELANDD